MKTHVLTPMSPDGKPGEIVEMEVSDGPAQYLEPLAANDDLGKLRANVHEARAKLHHAKSRGAGVAEAKAAFEAAKSEMDSAHRQQQKARTQQRTGIDYGAPSPFSRDTRQFMPVRDYSAERDDGLESPSEELSEEQLEAKILAAVTAVEQAQSNGASWAEVLRLEAALKVLRDQLPNPSAPPAATTAAPPRKEHITRPVPTQPTGQAAARQGWAKFLAGLDAKMLANHAKILANKTKASAVCCEGKYLCARCKAKAAA